MADLTLSAQHTARLNVDLVEDGRDVLELTMAAVAEESHGAQVVELHTEEAPPRKRSRRERNPSEEGWFNLAKVINLKFRWPGSGSAEAKQAQVLPIRGLRNDVPVKFEEGGAVPGDRIVGVLSEGEGIRIFQIHSPALKEFEHEKWIDVTWDIDPETVIHFHGFMPQADSNSPDYKRGLVTIAFFGLDDIDVRSDLFLERAQVIFSMYSWLQAANDPAASAASRRAAQRTIDRWTSARSAHANCARSFERLFKSDPAAAKDCYEKADAYWTSKF